MADSFYRVAGKRVLDLLIGLPLLLAALPVMAIVALAVRLALGSPVLFRQQRTGLGGDTFTFFKFRTMTDQRDADGNLLPDGDRLTRFGRFLRATSLDELPSLLNVLRGEMSLVGPRPLLPRYLDRYSAEQARRHLVKPGITGWTQTHGRNAIEWEKKFVLDVWYVDNVSLLLDLKIIALTVFKVLGCKDINIPGCAATPEFLGTPQPERQNSKKVA